MSGSFRPGKGLGDHQFNQSAPSAGFVPSIENRYDLDNGFLPGSGVQGSGDEFGKQRFVSAL